MNQRNSLSANYDRPMRIAGIVGLVAAVIAVVGLFISGAGAFFQAYLYAYLFWLGISLGLLAMLLLHFTVSSRWGLTIRRVAEAGAGLLPLMAVLFIPIILGLPTLYPWARPADVAASETLQHQTWYLNVPFFIIRAVIYFVVWSLLIFIANRRLAQVAYDPSGDQVLHTRLQGLGAGGLILYGITMTFAAVDWLMSLQPSWISTAFGLVVILAQVQTGLSFAVLALNLFPSLSLGRRWTYDTTPVPFRDLGALTMTLVMGWAYVAFFQLLIQWAGNIPREAVWYLARVDGGWSILTWFIFLFQFALPFAILLTMRVRHNLRLLAWIGLVLLVANLVNMFWHVKPAFFPGVFSVSWLDLVMPIAMGGIWLAGFLYLLKRRPALSPSDQEVISLTEQKPLPGD